MSDGPVFERGMRFHRMVGPALVLAKRIADLSAEERAEFAKIAERVGAHWAGKANGDERSHAYWIIAAALGIAPPAGKPKPTHHLHLVGKER